MSSEGKTPPPCGGPEQTRAAPQTLAELAELYDSDYYARSCGPVPYDRSQPRWMEFFGQVARRSRDALNPRRVLDAGCAHGFLVEAFWDLGVEAWGIDISPFAIANVRRDMQAYCRLGSISGDIEGHYDLITCIEVLEHMPEKEALKALESMCGATDTLLFSSTPSDFEEPTHINVRPLIYWLCEFQKYGFEPDLQFDAGFIAPHAMLLRKRGQQLSLEVLQTFASLLRTRQEVIAKDNKYNEAAASHQQAEARWAAEVAELRGSLVREQQEGRKTMRELEAQSAELVTAQSAVKLVLEQQDKLRGALTGLADKVDRLKELGPSDNRAERLSGRGHQLDELSSRVLALREDVRRLQHRLTSVEAETAATGASVQSMLNSRIWRTLVRGGRVLLGVRNLFRFRRRG